MPHLAICTKKTTAGVVLVACPSWANNTIVRRGEGRIGESCGDRAEVPMSWATEFAEVVKIGCVNLGFPNI